jgi:hypothetical protein
MPTIGSGDGAAQCFSHLSMHEYLQMIRRDVKVRKSFDKNIANHF